MKDNNGEREAEIDTDGLESDRDSLWETEFVQDRTAEMCSTSRIHILALW